MLRNEAVLCLGNGIGQNRSDLSDVELDRIAERLQNDPILLSIFASLANRCAHAGLEPILDDVIGRFISGSLSALAATKNVC